jgi:hypothetical protein
MIVSCLKKQNAGFTLGLLDLVRDLVHANSRGDYRQSGTEMACPSATAILYPFDHPAHFPSSQGPHVRVLCTDETPIIAAAVSQRLQTVTRWSLSNSSYTYHAHRSTFGVCLNHRTIFLIDLIDSQP